MFDIQIIMLPFTR